MSSTVAPCCAASDPGRPHVRASAARCAQVRSYKYTSPDDTLLESLILNRFWAFAELAFVPEWIAPNLLTFVGFLHALAAYALLLAHSPALTARRPPGRVACAACLFVYQTMDGMDGKQARRAGAGGPLGEVADHGADAIASCVYGVFLVDVFGIGWEFAYAEPRAVARGVSDHLQPRRVRARLRRLRVHGPPARRAPRRAGAAGGHPADVPAGRRTASGSGTDSWRSARSA